MTRPEWVEDFLEHGSNITMARPAARKYIMQLEADVERLRIVVEQARDVAARIRHRDWYFLSQEATHELASLETAATVVLREGKGGETCHEKPQPQPVVSAAALLHTTAAMPRDAYLTTVADIAQRLSGKQGDVQLDSPQTKSEPLILGEQPFGLEIC